MTGTLLYQHTTKGVMHAEHFYPLHPDSIPLTAGKVGCTVHFRLCGADWRTGKVLAKVYEKTPTYGRKNSQRKQQPLNP